MKPRAKKQQPSKNPEKVPTQKKQETLWSSIRDLFDKETKDEGTIIPDAFFEQSLSPAPLNDKLYILFTNSLQLWTNNISRIIVEYLEKFGFNTIYTWSHSVESFDTCLIWSHTNLPLRKSLLVFHQRNTSCLYVYNFTGTGHTRLLEPTGPITSLSRLHKVTNTLFLLTNNQDAKMFDAVGMTQISPLHFSVLGYSGPLFTATSYIIYLDNMILFFNRMDQPHTNDVDQPYFRVKFQKRIHDVQIGHQQLFIFLSTEALLSMVSLSLALLEDEEKRSIYYPADSEKIHNFYGQYWNVPMYFTSSLFLMTINFCWELRTDFIYGILHEQL